MSSSHCSARWSRPVLSVLLLTSLASCAPNPSRHAELPPATAVQPADETPERWYRDGALRAADQRAPTDAKARNLILFVGDGMSQVTVAAARIHQAQLSGRSGEENLLAFERFPHTALSKTYNTDMQTPDSAGTMTAMATGVKTRAGVISIDQSARRGDCAAAQRAQLPTLFELAESAGLATGVVTTTRLTHATPAATYAHSADRDWEADKAMPAAAHDAGCRDIARQFVEFDYGDGIELALGGGRAGFMPSAAADPEYPNKRGLREDGRNLIDDWQQRYPQGQYLWSAAQFSQLDPSAPGPVLGLFEPSHLQYELDRPQDGAGEPSLAELTRFAVRKLAGHPQGYVLVVEAGRIDHAHHAGNAQRALVDTVALSDAVQAAVDEAGADTLIVVTADHAHTLSFAGYPGRGNPILGLVAPGKNGAAYQLDAHQQPYTTLAYANGPGARHEHGRPALEADEVLAPDYLQEAIVPLASETHGGEDVAIYAFGPGAEAFRGVLEQNVIFHLLTQSQPALRRLQCQRGACERGVPVQLQRIP